MRGRLLRPLRVPARYAFVALAVLPLLVGAANAWLSSSQVGRLTAVVHQQDMELRAACGSAGDLGSIPIPSSPKPSRLAISLVTDNRAQWRTLHCPGSLPVPPGLAKWAAYYHLSPR